ncbi:MAG: hypothetical protein JWO27_2526 [Frankiales bacterium]|nr:hypothetical protein [Frankiales bacterium]
MSTLEALAGLQRASATSWSQRLTDVVVGWLAKRTSRRGFLVRSAVIGSALAVDTAGFALKPQSAYASVCGPGASCGGGWTVFCATVYNGVNACPPGSVAAGWWKADGASLCGGRARYIIDCNATCSRCSTAGRAGICSSRCWSCGCHCGPGGQCDQRRVCCNGFRYGQCNQQIRQVGAVMCRVVSCVPPWTYENCSKASATDNATRDHSSPALPGAWSSVKARYWQLGESASPLGPSVWAEFAVPGGRAQRYLHGRISYKAGIGPRYTVGPIGHRYAALGNEAGALGFPTSDPIVISNARASRFEKGRISWHPALGAFETVGPIASVYQATGSELGALKFPTASPRSARDGTGRFSTFQLGRISWHPSIGAHWMGRAVAARYVQLGAEAGRLGYPVSDELVAAAAHTTGFQGGRIVAVDGVGAFEVYDVLDAAYTRAGGERGVLGLPTAQELPAGPGRCQQFATGRISAAGGAAFWTRGPIAQRYVELGAEVGGLGFPTTDEYTSSSGMRRNDFEHGYISYDESTGQVSSG